VVGCAHTAADTALNAYPEHAAWFECAHFCFCDGDVVDGYCVDSAEFCWSKISDCCDGGVDVDRVVGVCDGDGVFEHFSISNCASVHCYSDFVAVLAFVARHDTDVELDINFG